MKFFFNPLKNCNQLHLVYLIVCQFMINLHPQYFASHTTRTWKHDKNTSLIFRNIKLTYSKLICHLLISSAVDFNGILMLSANSYQRHILHINNNNKKTKPIAIVPCSHDFRNFTSTAGNYYMTNN